MNLKNHPFAVEAFFDSSIVLTYALPKEELEDLIPEYIELDTFQKKYGFLAVAMVNTKYLRPKGAPKFLGNDFFLDWVPHVRQIHKPKRQETSWFVYIEISNKQEKHVSSRKSVHTL